VTDRLRPRVGGVLVRTLHGFARHRVARMDPRLMVLHFPGGTSQLGHRQDLSTEAMRARLGSIVPLIGGFPEEP
jgi:hypothetical protein